MHDVCSRTRRRFNSHQWDVGQVSMSTRFRVVVVPSGSFSYQVLQNQRYRQGKTSTLRATRELGLNIYSSLSPSTLPRRLSRLLLLPLFPPGICDCSPSLPCFPCSPLSGRLQTEPTLVLRRSTRILFDQSHQPRLSLLFSPYFVSIHQPTTHLSLGRTSSTRTAYDIRLIITFS